MTFLDFYQSHYYFVFNLFCVLVISLSVVLLRKKQVHSGYLKKAMLLFSFTLVFLVGQKFLLDAFFEIKLNSFDLDKDGFFSPEESTENQKQYMNVVTGDAGRHVFIFLGVIFSLIWSMVFMFICWLISLMKKDAE